MRKIIGFTAIFIATILVFSFDGDVDAAPKKTCYYMPGNNNSVVMPNRYGVVCEYSTVNERSYDSESTAVYTSSAYITFYEEGMKIGISHDNPTFVIENFKSPSRATGKVKLGNNAQGQGVDFFIHETTGVSNVDKIEFGGKSDGCPKYMTVKNPSEGSEITGIKMYFSEDPVVTLDQIQSVVYKRDYQSIYTYALKSTMLETIAYDNQNDDYDDDYDNINAIGFKNGKITFPTDDWTVEQQETNRNHYQNLVNECGEIKRPGVDNIKVDNNTPTEKTLTTCRYYFDDPDMTKCQRIEAVVSYSMISSSKENKLTAIAKYGVKNITNDIHMLAATFNNNKFNGNYSTFEDYIIYDPMNNVWKCPDKMYMMIVDGGDRKYFFQNGYDYMVEQYGGTVITSHKEAGERVDSPHCNQFIDDGKGDDDDGTNKDFAMANCEAMIDLFQKYFDWIKIGACILLVFFGTLDFAKAVLSSDQDMLKKATSNFVKRCIAALAIFFIPMLIGLIFEMPGVSDKIEVIVCNLK